MNQDSAEFPQLLATAARSWRRAFDAVLAEHNLSDAIAAPLVTLFHLGDQIPQNLLAERIGIDGSSIVRVLDTLERDGLITRVADARDRRVKLVQLTDTGIHTAKLVEELSAALRHELLGPLDAQTIDTAMHVLRLLCDKALPQFLAQRMR